MVRACCWILIAWKTNSTPHSESLSGPFADSSPPPIDRILSHCVDSKKKKNESETVRYNKNQLFIYGWILFFQFSIQRKDKSHDVWWKGNVHFNAI